MLTDYYKYINKTQILYAFGLNIRILMVTIIYVVNILGLGLITVLLYSFCMDNIFYGNFTFGFGNDNSSMCRMSIGMGLVKETVYGFN